MGQKTICYHYSSQYIILLLTFKPNEMEGNVRTRITQIRTKSKFEIVTPAELIALKYYPSIGTQQNITN